MASNLAKVLRLDEDPLQSDPLRSEMCRRLICTIAVMDHLLSPSLNISCHVSLSDYIKLPCTNDELQAIKYRGRQISSLDSSPANIIAEIMSLSHFFCEVCLYHRNGGGISVWQELDNQLLSWTTALHKSLVYSQQNFVLHQRKGTLRQFVYLNLLYHHICQLIYFQFLQNSGSSAYETETSTLRILSCYHHSSMITEIINYTWTVACFDIHNVSMGQMLTVAAAVHMHACLTATSKEEGECNQRKLTVILDCVKRIKEHCRIFDRIVSQETNMDCK